MSSSPAPSDRDEDVAARDRYDTAKFTDHEIEDELSNRPPRYRSESYLAALYAERERRAAKAPRSLVGRCHEALRKITEGSPEVVEEGLVEARRILEGPHFDCPACGRSFKVGSETSERIFCSPRCRDAR